MWLDKLETTPLRVMVSYAYLVFSNLPRVYIRLCKHRNHFKFLHYLIFRKTNLFTRALSISA